jgi:hypothetical protein
LFYTIPEIETGIANRLGLNTIRVDGGQGSDPIGGYTIVLQPNPEP